MNKSNRPSSEFVVCYSTTDNIHANLHAYCRGDGTVRDNNHMVRIRKDVRDKLKAKFGTFTKLYEFALNAKW